MKIEKSKELILREVNFLLIVTLFWFSQYIYVPHQISFLSGEEIGNYSLGIILGAYGISQLLLRFPMGILADYSGKHKNFIILGCFLAGIASFFRIFWPNGTGFLIGNLFSGVASSMWISFMVFYIGTFETQKEQIATSRIILFNNLGILVGFTASMLSYSIIGMKGICILSFLGGIIACILSLFINEPEIISDIGLNKNIKNLIQVCRSRRIVVFSILALIQQGIQLTTAVSFTNQILKNRGMSDTVVGLSSVIYMLSAVIFSMFSATRLCRKKSSKFWIPLILLILAFYTILIPLVESILSVLGLQILAGMSAGILSSYITSEAVNGVPKNKKSTAMGFYQTIYALGMAVFPIMTGNIVNNYGVKNAYFTLAAISIFGCILILIYYYKNENLQSKELIMKIKF